MIEEITQNLMIMRRILTINLNLATSEATKDEIMVTEEEEGAKVPLKPTEILTLKKKAWIIKPGKITQVEAEEGEEVKAVDSLYHKTLQMVVEGV